VHAATRDEILVGRDSDHVQRSPTTINPLGTEPRVFLFMCQIDPAAWAEGGMQVASEVRQRSAREFGTTPLATTDGLAEYQRLLDVYPSLGYEVTILPKVSVPERADFVLNVLAASRD
jgi:predicted ATPase